MADCPRCHLGLGCDLVYGDRRQVQASDTLDAWWDYHGVIFLNASNLKHGCRGREFANNADRCLPLNLCGLLLLHLGTIDLGGEIFPLAIRGRAGGLASAFNWIGSFAVGLLFPIMTAMMPQASVFAIFGVISIIAVLFVKFAVPETHGKSLEEIEAQGTR